jgi:ribose transport system permease protein
MDQSIPLQPTRRAYSQQTLAFLERFLSNSLLAATIVLVIFFSIIARDRNYFSFENLVNVLTALATAGFLTWSMAFAMLAGNIDWSTKGISAIASIALGVTFMNMGWPAITSILVVCAGCILVSLFTSFLIVNLKIPGLVATIAVNGLYIAIAMYLCNNYQINIRRPELENILVQFQPLRIPFSVWLMFIFFGIACIILYHTRLGAHIYAVGANSPAARLNGVRVGRVVRFTLMWSAVCIAMAAIIQTTRSGITLLYGTTIAIEPAFLPALLGGISIFGGRGRLENMLIAIVFVAVLENGLFIMSAATGTIYFVRGIAYMLALILSIVRDRVALIKAEKVG